MSLPYAELNDDRVLAEFIDKYILNIRLGAVDAALARQCLIESLPPERDPNEVAQRFDAALAAANVESDEERRTSTPSDAAASPEPMMERSEASPTTLGADASHSDQREPTQIDVEASPEPVLTAVDASPPSTRGDAFDVDRSESTPIDVDDADGDMQSTPPDVSTVPAVAAADATAQRSGCSCCEPGGVVDTAVVAQVLDMTEPAVRDAIRKNNQLVDGVWTAKLWCGIVATRPEGSRVYKFWVPAGLLERVDRRRS